MVHLCACSSSLLAAMLLQAVAMRVYCGASNRLNRRQNETYFVRGTAWTKVLFPSDRCCASDGIGAHRGCSCVSDAAGQSSVQHYPKLVIEAARCVDSVPNGYLNSPGDFYSGAFELVVQQPERAMRHAPEGHAWVSRARVG